MPRLKIEIGPSEGSDSIRRNDMNKRLKLDDLAVQSFVTHKREIRLQGGGLTVVTCFPQCVFTQRETCDSMCWCLTDDC